MATWTFHGPGIKSKVRTRDGRRVYYAEVWHGNKRHAEKAASAEAGKARDEEKARKTAAAMVARLQAEVDARTYVPPALRKHAARIAASQRLTCAELCRRFVESNPKIKSLRWYRDVFDALTRGGVLVGYADQVKADHVARYLSRRAACRSAATHNNELAVLRRLFNFAIVQGVATTNPAKGLKRLPTESAGRYLDATEQAALVVAADKIEPEFAPVLRFNLDTGGRASELSALDWRNVDLERQTVTFLATKNKRLDRTVPLRAAAVEVLRRLPTRFKGTGPVFLYRGLPLIVASEKGRQTRRYHAPWGRIVAAAKVEGRARFHDTRHTYASDYIMAGGSLFSLLRLCGWTDFKMVERTYGHLAPDYQRTEVDRTARAPFPYAGDAAGDAVHVGQ